MHAVFCQNETGKYVSMIMMTGIENYKLFLNGDSRWYNSRRKTYISTTYYLGRNVVDWICKLKNTSKEKVDHTVSLGEKQHEWNPT